MPRNLAKTFKSTCTKSLPIWMNVFTSLFKGHRCESDMPLYIYGSPLEIALTVPLNVPILSRYGVASILLLISIYLILQSLFIFYYQSIWSISINQSINMKYINQSINQYRSNICRVRLKHQKEIEPLLQTQMFFSLNLCNLLV